MQCAGVLLSHEGSCPPATTAWVSAAQFPGPERLEILRDLGGTEPLRSAFWR
jgi:hypothetical protein